MRRGVWGSVVMLVAGVGLLGWQATRQRSATPREATGIASDGGTGHAVASPEQVGAVNADSLRLGWLKIPIQSGQTSLPDRPDHPDRLGIFDLGMSGFAPMPAMQTSKTFAPDPATRARVIAGYGKLPLQFESNAGQTDKRVKFVSRGKGYTLFLTDKAEAMLCLNAPQKDVGRGLCARPGVVKHNRSENGRQAATERPPYAHASVVRMQLVGANPKPQVMGAAELPGKVNYFIGNDPSKWRTNVSTYAKAQYRDVYPGIDLIYYGNRQGRLEHDFIIAPGADPKQIAFVVGQGILSCQPNASHNLSGTEMRKKAEKDFTPYAITPAGDLVLHTSGGDVAFQKPIAYQDTPGGRREITARYALNPQSGTTINHQPSTITFAVGDYDKSLPLIIDPVLSYSTYLGGSATEYGNGIAVDGAGNAYVTGYTESTDFPTANPLQAKNGGLKNAFVAKLNAAGSALVYSTYLGGSGGDRGNGIAVDGAGNAYVTGSTSSTDFPTANPLQAKLGGGYDAFVAKLNAAGSALVYSTYLGGSDLDLSVGIAVDGAGNAYVTGYTYSTNFPTANPLQAKLGGRPGDGDAFVAKLNAAGSALVYSTYLGGSGSDDGAGIAVDGAGNAYVTGFTLSTDFPTANPLQAKYGGGGDAFVAKLNAAGSALVYSTYLGGSNFDVGAGIAVDGAGNAYVTGETTSTDFPTANPLQAKSGGGVYDAFVAKLNAAGSALVYSTYLGGSGAEYGNGIAVDGAGNAYVTGQTDSTDFPTASPLQAKNGGSIDAFVAKLNAAGSALVYSTYLGGSGAEYGYGIAVDGAGNAYVTGITFSADFPTANPLQPKFGGGSYDAFVAKIGSSSSNPPPTVTSITPNSGVNNAPVSITNLAGTGFLAGATVKLTKTGQTDITATSVAIVSATQITCTFDLTGKAAVAWNVVVTNTDAQTGTLANGFTVNNPAPTVTAITPSSGLNNGTVSITNLAGTGFLNGATVKLTKSGQTDIAAMSVSVVSGTQITCSFDLTGNTTGPWDVVVTNRDGQSGILTNGFTVAELYTISGSVAIAAGAPILGVTVSTNTGVAATTDAKGNYTLGGLVAGTYTLTPNKTDYTFAPATRDITVGPNQKGSDFVGTYITPDLLIKSADEPDSAYAGNNVYQVSPSGEQVKREWISKAGTTSVFDVKVENDSGVPRTFVVKAEEIQDANWTVTYKAGTQDISAAIRSPNGWTTGNLTPGIADIITVEMKPGKKVSQGASKSITLRAFLDGSDATIRDAVQATTTASVWAAPKVTGIMPDSGVNNGPVSIANLAGSGFQQGATVSLTKIGESDIAATNVKVVAPAKITCRFDLNEKKPGTWSVVVTNTDGQSGTLADKFTIIDASTMVHDIALTNFTASPNPVSRGSTLTFSVKVKNLGTYTENNVTFTITYGSMKLAGPIKLSNWKPGQEMSGVLKLAVPRYQKPGDYLITGQLSTVAGETNTDNNKQTVKVTVGIPQSATAPTLTNLSPNSGKQGETVNVTLAGTNFVSGATVNVSGTGVTVSNVKVVSATQITATFTIASSATTGASNVTVTTSNGTSTAVPFTVNSSSTPSAPTLTSISPNSGKQGETVNVTLTGTNFVSGATVNVSDTSAAASARHVDIIVSNVNVVSATKITALFAIALTAATGPVNVTVTTSNGTSNTVSFTINSQTSSCDTFTLDCIAFTPGNKYTYSLTMNGQPAGRQEITVKTPTTASGIGVQVTPVITQVYDASGKLTDQSTSYETCDGVIGEQQWGIDDISGSKQRFSPPFRIPETMTVGQFFNQQVTENDTPGTQRIQHDRTVTYLGCETVTEAAGGPYNAYKLQFDDTFTLQTPIGPITTKLRFFTWMAKGVGIVKVENTVTTAGQTMTGVGVLKEAWVNGTHI